MSDLVRQGNRERGWNDPPEFLHNETTSGNLPAKKTVLNQRVHHTLDSISNPIKEPVKDENAPKLTEPPKSNLPVAGTVVPESQPTTTNSEISVEDVQVSDIERILNDNVQYLKDNQLAVRACDDISKRIKIFVTNWPKLSDKVKVRMNNLAKALEKSELTVADDLHVKLILDFPSEVAQWMVGIKKLIHELITLKNKSTSADETNEQN